MHTQMHLQTLSLCAPCGTAAHHGSISLPCTKQARSRALPAAYRPSFCTRTARLQQRAHRGCLVVVAFESGDEVEEDVMNRMEKCITSVKRSFTTLRTGRASPDMVDRIEVDYYGAPTPLRQLAGISIPESSMIVIQPYDKGSMQAIEKAIQVSDLGLTPNNDGKLIRLNVPQLTSERRKELAKQASKLTEEGKVAIRNVRRDAMKAIGQLKGDGMSEDEVKALEDSVQEYTDDAVKQVDSLLKKKQEELTTV